VVEVMDVNKLTFKDAIKKIKLLEIQIEYLITIIERYGLKYNETSKKD
jgi:hypothetical protein